MASFAGAGAELGLFLPPAHARAVAFVIDGAFFAGLFVLSAGATNFAIGGSSSVAGWLLLTAAVVLVNAGFQSVVVWVSGGGSVGRAIARLSVRRRDGAPIAQTPSDFLRLLARFSIGYVLFSVLLLATPWCLVDRLRRCPHDFVLATQVAHVGNSEELSFRQRLRALNEDIEAGLAIVREQWGWAYRLIKWSSWLVVTTTAAFAAALTKIGMLTPAAAGSSSTPLPAVSSGSWTLSLPVAIGTTTVSATLVMSGVAISTPAQPEGLLWHMSFDQQATGIAAGWVDPPDVVLRGDAAISETASGNRALDPGDRGWARLEGFEETAGSITVEARVLARGELEGWDTIVHRWGNHFWLGSSFYADGYEWWLGNGAEIEDAAALEAGQWQHVVGTYDATSGRLRLYVDGRVVASGRSRGVPNATGDPLIVGNGGGGTAWKGLIDDVRIWDHALTPKEICGATRRHGIAADC